MLVPTDTMSINQSYIQCATALLRTSKSNLEKLSAGDAKTPQQLPLYINLDCVICEISEALAKLTAIQGRVDFIKENANLLE
jgi:hypothetical protein